MIPKKYSCQGEDISPDLEWSNYPKETKYFALVVDDPDAPNGTWVHWVLVNIPLGVNEISEGETEGQEIENDFERPEYGGPCPPSRKHRYYFRLYALSDSLEDVTKENFREKINEKAIDSASIMAYYQKE